MSAELQSPEEQDRARRRAHGVYGAGEGASNFHAGSSMLSGLLLFGGLGWLLDRWWGTSFALPIGVLLGAGLAFCSMWFRYGVVRPRDRDDVATAGSAQPSAVGRPPSEPDRPMEDDL